MFIYKYIHSIYIIPKILILRIVSFHVITQGKEAEIEGINTAYNCLQQTQSGAQKIQTRRQTAAAILSVIFNCVLPLRLSCHLSPSLRHTH